jgi:hypothetical protein
MRRVWVIATALLACAGARAGEPWASQPAPQGLPPLPFGARDEGQVVESPAVKTSAAPAPHVLPPTRLPRANAVPYLPPPSVVTIPATTGTPVPPLDGGPGAGGPGCCGAAPKKGRILDWFGYHPVKLVKWPPFCNCHANGLQHSVYDYFRWPACHEGACFPVGYGCGNWRSFLSNGNAYMAYPSGNAGLFYKPAN